MEWLPTSVALDDGRLQFRDAFEGGETELTLLALAAPTDGAVVGAPGVNHSGVALAVRTVHT